MTWRKKQSVSRPNDWIAGHKKTGTWPVLKS
jgi:hypothetical protein